MGLIVMVAAFGVMVLFCPNALANLKVVSIFMIVGLLFSLLSFLQIFRLVLLIVTMLSTIFLIVLYSEDLGLGTKGGTAVCMVILALMLTFGIKWSITGGL